MNNKKKVSLLSIVSITFLTTSLIAVAVTISDPLKRQLIAIFASTDPVSVEYIQTAMIFKTPSPSPLKSPSPTPRASTTPGLSGGYTSLSLIINPNAAPNRPGFNCINNPGVCPTGVVVSGFYLAPNGKYYPIAQSAGGPTEKDLTYIQKNTDSQSNNLSLNQVLNLPSGNVFISPESQNIQNQINQYLDRTPAPTQRPQFTIKPSPTGIVGSRTIIPTLIPQKTRTPTPRPTLPNISLNQALNLPSGNAFISPESRNLQNQIDKYLAKTPSPTWAGVSGRAGIIKNTPTPGLANISLNQALGNPDGTNPFMNPESKKEMDYLGRILDERVKQYQELTNVYSCKSGYILKQNEFGANFCQEDTAKLDPAEWTVKCDTKGCVKCGTGFLGLCYKLESIEATTPNLPTPSSLASKKMGDKCQSAYECGSGNCADSWIGSDGTKSISVLGKICTYDEKTQLAFDAANAKRQTDTVAYTAAGLGLTKGLSNPIELTKAIGHVATGMFSAEITFILLNKQDLIENRIQSILANLTGGVGYYSPSLDTRIYLKDGKYYRLDTGAEVNTTVGQSFLTSNLIETPGNFQHVTINQTTFTSPGWNKVEEAVKTQTAQKPYDVNSITKAVNNTLTYNHASADNGFGSYVYAAAHKNLSDMLSKNQTICFEFAATEQTYLATIGIPSQIVSVDTSDPNFPENPGAGHAFLTVTDKDGKKWAVDPTGGIVSDYDTFLKYLGAYNIEVKPSIYSFTNDVTPTITMSDNFTADDKWKVASDQSGTTGFRTIINNLFPGPR